MKLNWHFHKKHTIRGLVDGLPFVFQITEDWPCVEGVVLEVMRVLPGEEKQFYSSLSSVPFPTVCSAMRVCEAMVGLSDFKPGLPSNMKPGGIVYTDEPRTYAFE